MIIIRLRQSLADIEMSPAGWQPELEAAFVVGLFSVSIFALELLVHFSEHGGHFLITWIA